jgi:hypothetical protein
MKKNGFLGLLAILLVLGFVACGSGDNNEPQTYTVTIGTLTNGSITAIPTSGIAGTEITLTVNPDDLYRLKSGTLKYGSTVIDETSVKFKLPSTNVTVIGEFELLFFGTWLMNDRIIYSFSENVFTGQRKNGNYTSKGTWMYENPNKFSMTFTHSAWDKLDVETIDELKHYMDTMGYYPSYEYLFEFVTNSFFKLTDVESGDKLDFVLIE